MKNNQSKISNDSGTDLGLTKKRDAWEFKVFSPEAEEIKINFYRSHLDTIPYEQESLRKGEHNIWACKKSGVDGMFYSFKARVDSSWMKEVADPYVKLVSVNGKRGYIDLPGNYQPDNWEKDKSPKISVRDAIIYELQIRDFSIDSSSGIQNKGKYQAFTESGTVLKRLSTGITHLKELGVTHVHLMPAFDFHSIDETDIAPEYNWGYEPLHYNVPEGSFSSDPYSPGVRIKEFKEMVQAIHSAGMKVIMDVVYNHTADLSIHPFQQLAPDYYYRKTSEQTFSNASACGNETASEQPMMRKFMLESMIYWMKEYHVDGFRVDLMGIHDITTMNIISDSLRNIDPDVLIYGEGWKAGPTPIKDANLALKKNTRLLKDIAVFSDEIRDGLKGHYANAEEKGFISGNIDNTESVKFGIVGGVSHPDVDIRKVNYTQQFWSDSPLKLISYASCHDDYTLWDKLQLSNPGLSEDTLISMHKLASTIVLTSQGIPFLHAGVEFLRTKEGDHNSFQSPDSINSIKWEQKEKYYDVFTYHKGLIDLRKSHPAFRMNNANMINSYLKFKPSEKGVIIYELGPYANGDDWKWIRVILNGTSEALQYQLDEGLWKMVIIDSEIHQKGELLQINEITVEKFSAQILYTD